MPDEVKSTTTEGESASEEKARRKIPGNMPYTTSAGVLQRALEKIPAAEKPAIFTGDFLGTVLGITGGASRPIIPILKATGLLAQNGAPTELYAQFQTEGGRGAAALQALRHGYAEIFKRNQYAHRADENALLDIIVAITGLPRAERVVSAILRTFQTFQLFARTAPDEAQQQSRSSTAAEAEAGKQEGEKSEARVTHSPRSVGLVYNINVVLPETTNIEVYNTIFRSLKANML